MTFHIIFRNSRRILEPNRILYVDRAYVVVNKPDNFITQYPRDPQKSADSEAVAELVGSIPSAPNSTQLYPVHRLDKGTTGCLVFARSPAYAHAYSNQLRQMTVQKTYHALVNSSASPILSSTISGQIRVGISLKEGWPSVSSDSDARETLTDWEILETNPVLGISLVKLRLHTGIKHQLRVHMAEVLQAPILGDLQHTIRNQTERRLPLPNDRLFLHASEISFHRFRRTGKPKRVNLAVAAPLPGDFMQICRDAGFCVSSRTFVGGGLSIDGHPMQESAELDGFWISSIVQPIHKVP
ncbi:hypothetical protein D9757_007369 [Collybiopsis confluens]|uniref:21S rRNA pseudouridine(2819) synthase n=1 Tax=Collybiopsis confluens TaxID=2823264 RepID=A0A8H5HIU1_9AGAR|nr:hypothetical protein D9757_007369 [Collybiopsis confluens]